MGKSARKGYTAYCFLLTVCMLLALPFKAAALQWQKLAQTERHDVAIDVESVRKAASGRMAVCLKFTPKGERQRRRAADEYANKGYRLHLEYYEIDCDGSSASLALTDIIGPYGNRLARSKGNGLPEIIIPGSVLDKVAQRICPVQDETSADNDEAPVETTGTPAPEDSSDNQLKQEINQRIIDGKHRTEADPASHAAWIELGNAYYDADLHVQAIEAYDHALALKPDDADALNDQGAMYRQSGNIMQALKNFEKAAEIAPHNLESLYNMGYVYAFDLNRIDRAMDVWRRYLHQDKTSETARQVQSFIDRYGR